MLPILKQNLLHHFLALSFILTFTGLSQQETHLLPAYTNSVNLLKASQSPYVADHDVIVHKDATLVIEPGCELKFAKGKELVVFGTLIAKGNRTSRIKLTKLGHKQVDAHREAKYRLVEGDSLQNGKLQIFYNSKWNYVCSTQFKYYIFFIIYHSGWT